MCGLLLHSSLAVSREGLPLGLAAVKFWTRKKFKGCNALKKKINPTRVPIEQKESQRWLDNLREATLLLAPSERLVHIADREGDIYELFTAAEEAQTNFLIRTCVDRLAEDGERTVEAKMAKVPVEGIHRLLQSGEDVTEIGKGIDAPTPTGFDDGVEDGAALAGFGLAKEEPVLLPTAVGRMAFSTRLLCTPCQRRLQNPGFNPGGRPRSSPKHWERFRR